LEYPKIRKILPKPSMGHNNPYKIPLLGFQCINIFPRLALDVVKIIPTKSHDWDFIVSTYSQDWL
jgi:hypothetical protein